MRTTPFLPLRAAVLLAAAAAAPCALAGVGVTVAGALSDFQSSLDDYNLVSLNDATLDNAGDTQGGLAIGGSLTVTSTTYVATGGSSDLPGSSAPTLYVAGGLNLGGNTLGVNAGDAALPGLSSSSWSWNATQKQLTESGNGGTFSQSNGSGAYAGSSPLSNPGPASWNWSTLASNLQADSAALANAAATGTISVNSGQNLIFTPNTTPAAGSTVVFTLNASLLSGNTYNGSTFSNISISVPTDVNYVINVINSAGTTLFGSGANFNSGTNNGQLLWNFVGSSGSSVTLGTSGSFYGSILSPSMTVNTGGMTVNGQVAASSFSDSGAELHFEGFDAVAVVVPEPLTFALWGVGLCGVAVVMRRRLRD